MLYSQLRELEKKGMIERKIYKEKPPRVDYYLTPLGKRSIKVIDTLSTFGDHLMIVNGLVENAKVLPIKKRVKHLKYI
jgi:DNA-binding HxlR family transcriptional regulator